MISYIITHDKNLTARKYLKDLRPPIRYRLKLRICRSFCEYANFYGAVITELRNGFKPLIFTYDHEKKKLQRRRLLKKYFKP